MLLKCKLTKPMTRNDSGEGNGTPLQYPYLKNPMDRGAWWAAVHGVAKSWTWLSDFTFTFHFHALKKETATHSSVLAWRIAGMGEPGGLPSMGSHRVAHDWSNLAAAGMTQWWGDTLEASSEEALITWMSSAWNVEGCSEEVKRGDALAAAGVPQGKKAPDNHGLESRA